MCQWHGIYRRSSNLLFTDSPSQNIYAYNYDLATGQLSHRRVHLHTNRNDLSVPDGMTLDAQGNLWSARWEGGCVVQYNSTGRVLQVLDMPTEKITSVMFGGPYLSTLYITSAGGDPANPQTPAGALFAIELKETHGVKEHRSHIGLT